MLFEKIIVDVQAASPSSWKTDCMAVRMVSLSDSKLNATEFPKLFATEKKSRDIIVLLLE